MQTSGSPKSRPGPPAVRIFVVVAAFLAVGLVAAMLLRSRVTGDWSSRPATAANPEATEGHNPPVGGEFGSPDLTRQLSEQQLRGKRIYLTGVSPAGNKMTAVLGNSSTEVPAAALTCVNCHRHDGRGKPEGGIYPSDIRWTELTKPYGSRGPHGKTRPPYDVSMLKRSITMGFNSAGKPLDNAMPRYRMTHQDLADLVAYLKVLGNELDPGLSAVKIRIGLILPPQGQFGEMHVATRAAASAFVAEFNRQGGVYQREIELCFTEAPARISDRADTALEFIECERVFALVGSFIAGAEEEISRYLDRQGVPLIGARTLYPQLDFPLKRPVFYLTSGLHGQSRALVRFAHKRQPNGAPPAVLLLPKDSMPGDENAVAGRLRDVANTIEAECASLGWDFQRCALAPGANNSSVLAQGLARQQIDVAFSLLPPADNLRLLQAAADSNWTPDFYLPSDIAGRQLFDAPGRFDQRIFLSFSNLPSRQARGMQIHSVLAQKHNLPGIQMAAQFETLAALSMLAEGLQRAGADLSRQRLVEQLETLSEYRSGFVPPVTFGPNRRLGARGAYVVTIDLSDKRLVPVSDWVDGSSASQSGL